MTYKLSQTSLDKLEHVHPDLAHVVHRAMAYQVMDFSVAEGVRSVERQRDLLKAGATRTMNSKHLPQADGYSHAVDLYPFPVDMAKVNKGDAREISRFGVLAGLMLAAARELKVTLVWGADWDGDGQTLDHTFFDGPHFQIVPHLTR
jgi:peptidoglycan LD-endopeptidase CwlK